MTQGLRWGILGAGGIAATFVSDLLDNDFTVTAVGSRTQSKADEFASRFAIGTAHGSYAELVADPEVDVVYVATPHPFHHDDALLAIHAGKHVLVEKPFTLNQAEADEIRVAAADAGVIVLEAMWTRFLPHMVRIRELIAEGAIGEVTAVIADHTQSLPQNPEHRLQNPELGGGALLDLGIYPVSFAWDVLGEPETIVALSSPTATGVDGRTSMIFGYASGAQAVLHTSLDAAGPNHASVVGTGGWIDVDRIFYNATDFTAYRTDGSVIEHWSNEVTSRGMQYQAWELERRAAGGAPSVLPIDETVAIMATLDEVRRQIGLRYPSE